MASSTSTLPSSGTCGVWRRECEEDPIGDVDGADTSTLVLWLQTPCGVYVDGRWPATAAGRSAENAAAAGVTSRDARAIQACGSECWGEHAAIAPGTCAERLAAQKSFAGRLSCASSDTTGGAALAADKMLSDLASAAPASDSGVGGVDAVPQLSTLAWARAIDYHPPTGGADVGVCAFAATADDGSRVMRETGADADYAETWKREPGTHTGPFMALELVSESRPGGSGSGAGGDVDSGSGDRALHRQGFWVRCGDYFAYAVGRPMTAETAAALGARATSATLATTVGSSLLAVAKAVGIADDAAAFTDALSSYCVAIGKIEAATSSTGDSNGAAWVIAHSTAPMLVGCALVDPSAAQAGGADAGGDTRPVCSYLSRAGDEGEAAVGDVVVESLGVGGRYGVRRWKVVERSADCALPFVPVASASGSP